MKEEKRGGGVSRLAKPADDGEPTCRPKSGERSEPYQPHPDEGTPPRKVNTYPAFNVLSYKYGNPRSRIVGISGKRLAISPTKN